jgi:hypothetical protein
MYVGNIITSSKIDLENFNIVKKFDDIDNNLPTLIIGWEKAKKQSDGISILHKKINQRLFWTFTLRERKVDYEVDLEKFKELCFNQFGDNIPYVYLDLIHGKRRVILKIVKKIMSLKNPVIYFSEKNMVYIFEENIVFGVDLNIIEYTKLNKEKVIEKIKNIGDNVLVSDEIFNKCKDLLYKIKFKNKLIPYIYKNGEFE